MAEKGLIEKSTLQGFADEVRRLAESEQTGTPAEMLALLQTVEAGGGAPVYGSFTPSADNTEITTGVEFPQKKNYFLMAMDAQVGSTLGYSVFVAAYAVFKNGTFTEGVRYSTTSSNNYVSSPFNSSDSTLYVDDFTTGKIHSGNKFKKSRKYVYAYMGWDD